ncbi:MAG: hypothetical protein ACE5MM_07835 [Nitrospiraceae bacterium]
MSATAALLKGSEEGLSEDDLRVATALIYARFRGLFTSVTKDFSREGHTELVVWRAGTNGPLFRIGRWNGRYVAIDESTGKILDAARLESLLEAVRALYPPISAF